MKEKDNRTKIALKKTFEKMDNAYFDALGDEHNVCGSCGLLCAVEDGCVWAGVCVCVCVWNVLCCGGRLCLGWSLSLTHTLSLACLRARSLSISLLRALTDSLSLSRAHALALSLARAYTSPVFACQ